MKANSRMNIFFHFFFRGVFLLGIFFPKGTSCEKLPIIRIDPAHLSSIFEDDQMMRDLTEALSEIHPLLLQTSPGREFYHSHHSDAAVHSFSASKKKNIKGFSTNTNPDPIIVTLPNPRPRSSSLFPPRKEVERKFSSPQLTYGFVPRDPETGHSSPKRENYSFHMSQNRNFPTSRLNSEILSVQTSKLQKIEQSNEREKETKNKQISALRDHLSHFPNRDVYYRTNWDGNNQRYPYSKVIEAGMIHFKPQNNAERGQESVRRPTTLIRNSHVPDFTNKRELNHHKQEYSQLSNRKDDNAIKKSSNKAATRRPLSFALKVNLQDASVYKVNGINGSLQDQPVVLLRNPEVDSPQKEEEKKRYPVLKTSTMVTTKRPASAPFTATSFFRNVPQSSPRDATVLSPEYSSQVSPVLPNKLLSVPSTKLVESTHQTVDKSTTTVSYSDEYNNDFHLTGLKKERPGIGYSDKDLHYEEDLFGDVTEVYSQDSFAFLHDGGIQKQGNSSFHPISSSSSASYTVHQNNDEKAHRKKSEAKKPYLKKSFANTKSTSAEDFDMGDNYSIPGQPGTDYPTYYEIPLTNFDCKEFQLPGFYADEEADCQVFHNCDTERQKHSFLCPNGTVFNQELFICDWWYNVKCEDSPLHFPLHSALK
ncbi:uncharacterized protein LOC129975919 [Argiope bruennichi]|uniref:U-scoloptoxin(01)-Er1a like protein n=1 Tax=Argiope bruennichi TaxID=94029 RepID=A0A8T0ENF5_ARGBR|nr:uncharacterized protein LOC129975919 [Argiope bruennichi]KAF8776911.1 U-scoloptoxin(01)-Er1a like protein [Argiope bruennichi]